MSFLDKIFKTVKDWHIHIGYNPVNAPLLERCWLEARKQPKDQIRRATVILKGEMSITNRIARAIEVLEE